MKNFKYQLLTLSLLFTIASCSSIVGKREISSLNSNASCRELISSIIINPDYDFPRFSEMMKSRSALKQKYTKVLSSITDFDNIPDAAVRGKAKLVLDPAEGFLTKIAMIRDAKQSIDLTYYIFHQDNTGKALLHEVRKAIKRGVKVRIMVDSLGSMQSAPFHKELMALQKMKGGFVIDQFGKRTGQRATPEIVLINPVFNVRGHLKKWMTIARNLFRKEGDKLPTFRLNRIEGHMIKFF